jgi:Tfp pilus assembly protein PilF
MSERNRVALLLAVALLVYANTLLNGFVFDDELYIFSNPAVTHVSAPSLFRPLRVNNVFRPVTFATLAANWTLGKARPFGYHLFNVLLHAAVTLLLYLVLRKLLEALPQAGSIAFTAAMIFAVHPIHTEAVAWITARSELLAAFFLLGAWIWHLNDRQVPALVCLVLAMMSKESAVVFLPLAMAGDYARGNVKPYSRYALIAGTIVLYMGVFWKIEGGRFGEKVVNFLDNPLASLPASLRVFNALPVAWKYVGLQLYPARLSCDYSYNAILLHSNWRYLAVPAVATFLVLALWVWTVGTRRNEWFLAGAIYLGSFSVTTNVLVPTGTIMGERLAYLPSAGICLLAALIWVRLENRARTLAWAVLVILVVCLAMRTAVRNLEWRDDFTLFSTDVQTVPGSAKAHCNLGAAYLHRGQLELSRAEMQTALRIYPDFPEALEGYGLAEVRMGRLQEGRSLLEKAVSVVSAEDIHHDQWEVNLAALLIELGQNDDALKILNDVIIRLPEEPRVWSNRATIHYRNGDLAAARRDVEAALRLDPGNLQAQSLLEPLKGVRAAVMAPQ